MSQWFKFYGQDFQSDPKMLRLNPTQRLLWVYLLCQASQTDDGIVNNMDENMLKALSHLNPDREEWKMADGVLDIFKDLKMIEVKKDTVIIINYKKHQDRYLTDAEKQQRYRDRIKEGNESYPDQVTKVTPNRIEQNRVDKNRIDKIYTLYQGLINKNSRLVDKAVDKIRARLKNFTDEDLLKAIKVFSENTWWMEHNSGRGVAWFFNSDERIDQFLNLEDKLSEDEMFEKLAKNKKS